MTTSDVRLPMRARRPDGSAAVPVAMPLDVPLDIGALFREQWIPMVRLAVLLVDDVGAAEDAVQDAFVALQRNRRVPTEQDAAVAYLRVTVVNRCRSVLRHRYVVKRLGHQPEHGPEPIDPSAAIDSDAAILRALQTLPRRQREVLVLRYWADLPHAEIAEILHIAVGSVKSAASRGLASLRTNVDADRTTYLPRSDRT